ncbi:hypothetical protein [Cellulomonas dongxiuzhuiae]|uniref:Ribosomally synthesized peptide with SipW-like signal peptide n=1 Tax=Cellulomonas dongxiuzhuiae TaxID=2819979 RepID=A0ABX8GLJ1_9CELL|nr:hypothetical protein [Cellulomonas dongxiuzhuiae]MBO3096289.1 hypothetical protein [Cellulomonas dongxiuzhuiae]QWC16708.1 hypothetical protein KKR89_03405 [Cellulomonas dongxiuzhuiae]
MIQRTTGASQQGEEPRRRAGVFLRFGLAGIAVLGIGAAATSAAWTDQAWFAGNATSVTVDLQGSTDGRTWADADTSAAGVVVQVPAAAFDDLNQGADVTVTLHLRNAGTVPLTLGAADVVTDRHRSTSIFAGTTPATATVAGPVPTLAAGATTTATLRVVTPRDWPATYQGRTGTLAVTFTGQS